jgi:hypothetical protein
MNAEIDPVLSNSNFTFVDAEFSENVSGKKEINQSIKINQEELTFNNTVSTENISINYSEVLQTGRHPNITSTVNLTDKAGNKLENLRKENITVNTFRRKMVEGWNFVSLPIAADYSYNISEVINKSQIEAVWTRENDSWSVYDPEAPLNDFNKLEPGVGYLLRSKSNFTWNPNVFTPVNLTEGSDGEYPRPSLDLENGWHFLGHYQEFRLADDADSSSTPPGAFASIGENNLQYVYEQDETGSRNLTQITGITQNVDAFIDPGNAYWVQTQDNVTYTAVSK